MSNVIWLDFNDAADQSALESHAFMPNAKEPDNIKTLLLARLHEAVVYLFPEGKQKHQQYFIGDVQGNPGKSLVIELAGERAGVWIDFATGEAGDIVDLWAAVHHLSAKQHFVQVKDSVHQWLHLPATEPKKPVKPLAAEPPMDTLGPPSFKWDYQDAEGNLIACVYRYDPPEGKVFRPWDVKARAVKAPDPRPLYNLPKIVNAHQVILVEGEKAAEALIQQGVVATTAMNGSHAPVEKTDWSPLKGKDILIWPDQDEPGYLYADKAAKAIAAIGANSVAILTLPDNTPHKWDAWDAVAAGIDVHAWIEQCERDVIETATGIPHYALSSLLNDHSPMPEDLIAPRVLTPGGLLVLGGAPKVGKSDFMLSWLTHMAAGEDFLGLTPKAPLKVFYLQAEVQYHYLRERIQQLRLPQTLLNQAQDKLWMTPQLKCLLNDHGVYQVKRTLEALQKKGGIDVLVLDPIRNLFDGGEEGNSENDNSAMLYFLRERVEPLRQLLNPNAGIILVHHTKKIAKRQLEEDPFLALSGAGCLRGYYSTGMLLYRPNEDYSQRQLVFELRNGPGIPAKHIDKVKGRWVELNADYLGTQGHSQAESMNKKQARETETIKHILLHEAAQGRVYTANQFAQTFEHYAGLGGRRTLNERLANLAAKQRVRFFKNAERYQLPLLKRSKFGYLWVEGMAVPASSDSDETDKPNLIPVQPTHMKCDKTGGVVPIANLQKESDRT